jgi:hypothetical protein
LIRHITINCAPFLVSLALWLGYIKLIEWRTKTLRARRLAASSLISNAPEIQYEPCPACQSTCELCGGDGEVRCEMVRCGGQGFLTLASVPCRGAECKAETGKIAAGCTLCLETGIEVTQKADCPSCHGTGRVKCFACAGTGRAPTGRKDGAYQAHGGSLEPPLCSQCKGLARVPQMAIKAANSV